MEKLGVNGKTQCHGIVSESGERCKRTTFDSSSYCQLHRDQFTAETEFGILKCKQCVVRDCQERDKAPKGMCFFELYDETRAFDTRDKTLKAMREVLRTEYTMKNRLERELSRVNLELVGSGENGGDRIAQLFSMYHSVCNSIAAHLEKFGKFQGYEAGDNIDESTKKKMEAVDRALNASRKKRDAKKTMEAVVTVEAIK
jgi:hypothetical protein